MNTCSICLEAFCNASDIVKLGCKHKFHLPCIIIMSIKSPKYNECPICRTIFQVPNIIRETEDESKNIRKENETLKADMDEIHREARRYIEDAEQLAAELLHRVHLVQQLQTSLAEKDDKIYRLKTNITRLETENNELHKKQLNLEEERDNLSEVVRMFEFLLMPSENANSNKSDDVIKVLETMFSSEEK